MKIVGLITEYNPFHNGHLHHLEAAKETTKATHSIAIMSGHFLQRGEPAILDKWTRAKNAVEAGVDLVIELPTLFACSSAEYFAYGAVSLLKDLNCIDALCFGSEAGRLNEMQGIANLLSSQDPAFEAALQTELQSGLSFPKARENAIHHVMGDGLDFHPNNILGIEYLKAINILDSPFEPFTIQRKEAAYMSTSLEGHIASATAIRSALKRKEDDMSDFVPPGTLNSLKANLNSFIFPDDMAKLLLYKIRTMSPSALRAIHDVSEGLEMRIKAAGEKASDYQTLIALIVTKRYTRTRIQRILIKILLDIKKDDIGPCGVKRPAYARILAFNKQGQDILNAIKKTTHIPLVTNINKTELDPEALQMLKLDIKATNIYHLLYEDSQKNKGGRDYVQAPIRI